MNAPFRLHDQVQLGAAQVDTGLAGLVRAAQALGIRTEGSCERDYIRVGSRVILSDHAYLGLAGTDDLQRLLASAITSDPGLARPLLADVAQVPPGCGNGYDLPRAHPLRDVPGRCSVSIRVWHAVTARPHVGATVLFAFPTSLINRLTGALSLGIPR